MSLEAIIQANTGAIIALTEALIKTVQRADAPIVPLTELLPERLSKEAVDHGVTHTWSSDTKVNLQNLPKDASPKKPAPEAVSYRKVRELILASAKDHGPEIKAICKANGVNKPSELLVDPEDFDSEIKDQAKLDAIYAGLLKIGG